MENKEKQIELSVVIPCYNCEKTIVELHERLSKTLNSMGVLYEIIYVNDNSRDTTGKILKQLARENKYVVSVDLMFNTGQFMALICGLELSQGRYVITMDDDLQHPPEEIVKLYHRIIATDEVDAVIGKYRKKNHSLFRNMGSLLIQKLSVNVKNNPKNVHMTSFRCLKRELVDALVMHRTMFPLMGTLIRKSTSRIINVDVEHHERKLGKSNYSLLKLIQTTLNRLFNYTSLPLKLISGTGLVISLISFGIAVFYFIKYSLGYILVPGWTTIVLLISFYAGLILLSIAVIGEYVIRILSEVSGNPRYCIRNIHRSPDQNL